MWPVDFNLLTKNAFASGFFYENFQLLKEAGGYFDSDSALKPLMHLWSLAIEEQFYIAFPILCLLLWHTSRRVVIVGVLTALFTAASLLWFLQAPDRSWVFYFPITRFWELGAGILLSYAHTFFPREEPLSRKLRSCLSVGALLMLVTLFFLPNASAHHPGLITVAAVASAVILIAARPDALINRTLLSWRPMTFVGLISYSLYLWHWPLISFLNLTLPEVRPWMKLTALATAFMLATLVYFFVENPVRHCKAPSVSLSDLWCALCGHWLRFVKPPLFSALLRQPSLWLLALVFLLNCSAAFVRLHPGVIPIPYSIPDDLYFAKDSKYYDAGAFHSMTKNGEAFHRVVTNERPLLALAGDSHMEMYLRRAVELAHKTGVNFENDSLSGCFIFGRNDQDLLGDDCLERQLRLDELLRSGLITNFAIAAKWGNNLPQLREGLTRFAKQLDEHPEVNVWIILDAPWDEGPRGTEGSFDPRKHTSRFDIKSDLWFHYPQDTRWIDGNNTVRAILGARVHYIETEPHVCRGGQCNLKYYLNDDHLQTDFTEKHAVWIDPIFEAVAAQRKAD